MLKELTWVSQHMQTSQVFHFVLPRFLGELPTLYRVNTPGTVPHMRTPALPAPLPAQLLPAGGAARTRLCLAPRFGAGSCNGHRSRSVTVLVPSLKNEQLNVVPPQEPQGAGIGTYLMGSCMACSHDQQLEKRWNMLSRDGLFSAPMKRTYRCVLVLGPAACAFSPCLGASHPGMPRLTAQRCCLQPGAYKPGLGTNPSPSGQYPWLDPALAAPSHITGVQSGFHPLVLATQPVLASPLRSRCLNLIWI